MIDCEQCGADDATKRSCGICLCDDCYREHLDHEPSVGIFRCMICHRREVEDELAEWGDMRRDW